MLWFDFVPYLFMGFNHGANLRNYFELSKFLAKKLFDFYFWNFIGLPARILYGIDGERIGEYFTGYCKTISKGLLVKSPRFRNGQ